jgi:TonB family protein
MIASQMNRAFACCSLEPAVFSNTRGLAAEVLMDNKVVHLLGYQNNASNWSSKGGGNAMLLPIPAKLGSMSEKNILDTSSAPTCLEDMVDALKPRTKGFDRSFTSDLVVPQVKIFEFDIYTIILANNVQLIPDALKKVPAEKRPEINKEIFDAYANWYKGWTFALCCFNNRKLSQAKPMIWWYEPLYPKKLFFPALDAHTGHAPKLDEKVAVDHQLIFASYKTPQDRAHKVAYKFLTDKDKDGKPIDQKAASELKKLLPLFVLGEKFEGTMIQGDFAANVSEVQRGTLVVDRIGPGQLDGPALGSASSLLKLATAKPPGGNTAFGTSATRAKGNIAPYRKEMLLKIARIYKASSTAPTATLQLEILHDGTLKDCQVIESSGNKEIDEMSLQSCKKVKFSALPDWYKGDKITFKIDFAMLINVRDSK